MSTLKVNTLQDSSGTNASTTEQINQGRAKVWCNFNGSGTAAINDSFNVSSLTDNGTGDYTLSFTSAFANTNYAFSGSSGPNSEYISNHLTGGGLTSNYTTSSCRFTVRHTYNNNLSDAEFCEVIICGDS